MFALDRKLLLQAALDLALISDEYEVLHFDEVPILFTGVNRYQSRIIGSSVEEDVDARVERFFHVIVPVDTYSLFMHRKISYRNIILNAGRVFVIDRAFDQSRCDVYLVGVDRIPDDYLPSEESYCPETRFEGSFVFGASLKGKLADLHQADPSDLRLLETSFPGMVSDAIGSFGNKLVSARPMILPYAAGSFRLQFAVQPVGQLGFFGGSYPEFTLRYVDFCMNRFHDEIRALGSDSADESPYFRLLLDAYQQILNMGRVSKPGTPERAADKAELLKAVKRSVDRLAELADVIGKNFTRIELSNVFDGTETLISTLDRVEAQRLSYAADLYDQVINKAEEESVARAYEIVVYNLNTETRRGKAHALVGDSLQRVGITVGGTDPLEETRFTASLDKSLRISVMARGKRVAGKLKSLRIEYEK
ncbi:hypothetical protein WME79_19765 [Sorangium sp. So ce726]|uniref:hypothetical protein n=1 Tax=Sorangium sp. So ce726 TaxID=3133319 RepID=UPI003F604035